MRPRKHSRDTRTNAALDDRRSPRVAFRVPALVVAEGEDAAFGGFTRDISVGGMFVELPPPIPFSFGQNLRVCVRLPGQQIETVLATTVRWIDAKGMGLQFRPMGARETHAITEIVAGIKK